MPTTHTTPIDLRGFHGREFEGVITQADKGYKSKGKISVNDNQEVYCCQNEVNGFNANDKMGFNYSVCVQFQDDSVWNKLFLTSITILDQPSSIDPRWDWKDGEIVYIGGNEHTCHVLKDDLVCFMSHITGVSRRMFRFKVAYDFGYRKTPSPPTRKLIDITEEMFDKMNLIGRKVEYNEEEYQVSGMIHSEGVRILKVTDTDIWVNISQCKLIEE